MKKIQVYFPWTRNSQCQNSADSLAKMSLKISVQYVCPSPKVSILARYIPKGLKLYLIHYKSTWLRSFSQIDRGLSKILRCPCFNKLGVAFDCYEEITSRSIKLI